MVTNVELLKAYHNLVSLKRIKKDEDLEMEIPSFRNDLNEEIDLIEQTDKAREGKPLAQAILAQEMTALVHGQSELDSVIRVSKALFEDGLSIRSCLQD